MTPTQIQNFLKSRSIKLAALRNTGYITESQYQSIKKGFAESLNTHHVTEENKQLLITSIPLYLKQSLGEWDKLNKE